MNEPPLSEEAIFSHAVDLPPAERSSYVNQACGDDGALRTRIEALLRSHEEAGNLLDAAPGSRNGVNREGSQRKNYPSIR